MRIGSPVAPPDETGAAVGVPGVTSDDTVLWGGATVASAASAVGTGVLTSTGAAAVAAVVGVSVDAGGDPATVLAVVEAEISAVGVFRPADVGRGLEHATAVTTAANSPTLTNHADELM